MKIVHFSDWHGDLKSLPDADLYVCTGDMLPNDPSVLLENYSTGEEMVWNPRSGDPRPYGFLPISRIIHAKHEESFQEDWIKETLAKDVYGYLFGNPNAPVVCVRGNHDFTDLAPMFFGGKRKIYEITFDANVNLYENDVLVRTSYIEEVNGITVSGMRGITYICGEWSDELKPEMQYDMVMKLPKEGTDLIVSHSPPQGILDAYFSEKIGMPKLSSYVQGLSMAEKRFVHCFGHNHEDGALMKVFGDPFDIVFSNAATYFNIIEFEFNK